MKDGKKCDCQPSCQPIIERNDNFTTELHECSRESQEIADFSRSDSQGQLCSIISYESKDYASDNTAESSSETHEITDPSIK